jgi:hypothetical protein
MTSPILINGRRSKALQDLALKDLALKDLSLRDMALMLNGQCNNPRAAREAGVLDCRHGYRRH